MKKLTILFFALCLFIGGKAQDYTFSVTKHGTGNQAVLFIPGFACSGEVWQETVEYLDHNCTCYVLTMAGFAGMKPEENPSFENWKQQIARFIRDQKLAKPILVGHSLGGGLVLALASDYPELFGKAVIVDALPCLKALGNPNFQVNRTDSTLVINQIVNIDSIRFREMQKMSVAGLTTDTLKYDSILQWGLKSDRKTYGKLFWDYSNTDLRERITNIKIPTLVLLEPNFKPIDGMIREQFDHLKTMQLKYANKGLHFIMFDDKDWFLNQLRDFIVSVPN